jgi:hypothetical protein
LHCVDKMLSCGLRVKRSINSRDQCWPDVCNVSYSNIVVLHDHLFANHTTDHSHQPAVC